VTGVRLLDAHGAGIEPAALRAEKIRANVAQLDRNRRMAESGGFFIESDAHLVFGTGIAARIVATDGLSTRALAAEVAAILAAIPREGSVVPIAFGALPFDSGTAAELVIPMVTHVGENLDAIAVIDANFEFDRFARHMDAIAPVPDIGPRRTCVVHFPESRDEYLRRVEDALDAIRRDAFEKVVLARECIVRASAPYRREALLATLRATQPQTALFSIDGFLGATPELLVERAGDRVNSIPLAGTVARSHSRRKDAEAIAALFDSNKERFEHRVVVEEIEKALATCGVTLESVGEPRPLELESVIHLATQIEGTLDGQSSPRPSALELAVTLHPSPAIGGFPRDPALAYLKATEPFARGRYGGPVGYVDADGDGAWWIGIRSAEVADTEATCCAGGGIVAGSDPQAEFDETEAKFAAILPALTAH
jgi:isochorismate synthase